MPVGVNFGSGQRKFTSTGSWEWINVDCQPKWEPDLLAVPGKPLALEDGSVDIVVLHHVLEHFGCGEADAIMADLYRVLRPGGSMVVCVPNITALCGGYMRGALDPYQLMVNLYGAYMGDEADRHKWGYTPISLDEYLRKWFGRVQPFGYRELPGANIARDWWILSLEGVK